jgi:bacterioferritin
MSESMSMNKKWLELSDPYPKVEVEQENRYYAKLLLEDYAGATSELTAVTQYIYHSITSKGEAYGIAELLRRVAITEMRHFEMLGETIQLLGSAPLLRVMENNHTVFWNAQYIYYGSDVIDKLSANIAREATAIKNYQMHNKAIVDPYITALLDRIIMDEEHHYRLFQEAKATLNCKSYIPFG